MSKTPLEMSTSPLLTSVDPDVSHSHSDATLSPSMSAEEMALAVSHPAIGMAAVVDVMGEQVVQDPVVEQAVVEEEAEVIQAGPVLPLENIGLYDVDDDADISFIYNDEVCLNYRVLNLRAGNGDGSRLAAGTMVAMQGEEVDAPIRIINVSVAMVEAFWETPKALDDEGFSNQGSFSEANGYTKGDMGANELVNCAAYAHGAGAWLEPNDYHDLLGGDGYTLVANAAAMNIGSEYVIAYANHFIKAEKTADGVETSETNGDSAAYDKSYSAAQFDEYMVENAMRLRGLYLRN